MDKTNLVKTLHDKVNQSSSLQDILIVSKCIELLKIGSVKIVATYTDLLDIFAQKGEVYFVEDEERLYYGMGSYWYLVTQQSSLLTYAWGANIGGYLGDNTTTTRSSPVSVVGGFTDWVQVSGGNGHSLGLRANGTAWGWGFNQYGRLGDGTTTNRSSPVSVVGGFTDWVQVSAGSRHSLGLRANGTAWGWGANYQGYLGDGTTTNRSSPVSVVGGFTDWVQVAAGYQHSLGLKSNGTAWAWGYNDSGRLGDGTITYKSSPVSVVGGFTDWVQLDAGGSHSLGLRANGTAWAWGNNRFGYLGDGTTTDRSSPVSVIGGFTDWAQVSAGSFSHSLGLRTNGTTWAWGANNGGYLGDGTTVNKSSPVSVVGGFTDWVQVSAWYHSLAVRANGTAWAWGYNGSGQLGDNTTTSRLSPVSVIGGFTDWVQVSAGSRHSLGIRGQHNVRCRILNR